MAREIGLIYQRVVKGFLLLSPCLQIESSSCDWLITAPASMINFIFGVLVWVLANGVAVNAWGFVSKFECKESVMII